MTQATLGSNLKSRDLRALKEEEGQGKCEFNR